MLFSRFFERRRRDNAASSLYLALVGQARRPEFFTRFGVPDTVEGRFDMIILHAYALMRRLGGCSGEAAGPAKDLSQATFDLMFADMDRNLREMGVTDLGVGKRVRRMAESFFGRVSAYDKARGEGDEALQQALARNLYQTGTPQPEHLAAMARYVVALDAHLAGQADGALLEGRIHFPEPEGAA